MQDPSLKYLNAVTNVSQDKKSCLASDCPLEVMLAQEALGLPIVENALHRAYDIYRGGRNSKIVMESLLFCMESKDTLIQKISNHMTVVAAVPAYYAEYFFNPDTFADMFDRLDYIEELANRGCLPHQVKDKVTKQLAITEGFSFIISHFKGGVIEYTASEYLKRLLAIANKYVAQAQNSGIMSKESDKLYKWIQLAAKLNISLKDIQDNSVDDALQDIKIALEYDSRPVSIDTLPSGDVLRG